MIGTPQNVNATVSKVLESNPTTESGTAGGSKSDMGQTNAGPSNLSLAAQAATPAIVHGASKVVGKVLDATLAARAASRAVAPAVSEVGSATPAEEVIPSATKILENQAPPVATKTQSVPLSSLTSYEGAPDRAAVDSYKAQIAAGKQLEPLQVRPDSQGNLGIEDGKHRFQALQESGKKNAIVAYDYNPNEKIPNEPVPASQLHPEVRNVFNETPPVAEGNLKAAPLARNATAATYNNLGAETAKLAEGMSEHDKQLIDQIEIPDRRSPNTPPPTAGEAADRVTRIAKQANNPSQFTAVVNSIRKGLDTRYLGDTEGLGRDVAYRQNYLPRIYEHTGPGADYTPDNPTPGYTKGRVIATKEEAKNLAALKDENGNQLFPNLKLANSNAVEDHLQAMRSAGYEHGDEAFRQAIQQAHPGAVVKGNGATGYQIRSASGNDISQIYNKRLNPSRPHFPYAVRLADGTTKAVTDGNVVKALKENPGSRLINGATNEDIHSNAVNRIIKNAKTDPLGTYDKANAKVKKTVLYGGLFHSQAIGLSTGGNQLVRLATHPGQIPRTIADNASLLAGTLSKGAHAANMARFTEPGLTDFSRQVGTTLGRGDGLAVDVGGKATKNTLVSKGLNAIHDMVFNRQIPEAKLMMMKQYMDTKFPGMDYRNPTAEQVKYGQDMATAVNNFGGINRATTGLTPRQAQWAGRVFLSPDYTEGKIRTMTDALTKAGPRGNFARQTIFGRALLTALPGVAALTAAGKINWSDPKDIAEKVGGQLIDPTLQVGGLTIRPPRAYVSELAEIIKPMVAPLDTYDNNPLSGAESYATNRIAALPMGVARIAQNKDYYGNPIITGNPLQSAGNVANQFAPIPAAQIEKLATGQQGVLPTALNIAGEKASAPKHSDVYNAYNNEKYNILQGKTGLGGQKSAIVKQINKISATQPNKAARLAQEWNDSIGLGNGNPTNAMLTKFEAKYPQWAANKKTDSNYTSLKISTHLSAIQTRARNSAAATKINNLYQ